MSPAVFSPYTDHPEQSPTVIFPNHGMQILSSVVYVVGITVTTYCVSMRFSREDLWTKQGLMSIPWPRICTLIVFLMSWCFMASSSILVNGTGLSLSPVTCALGIWTCIVFYVLSKVFIYLFLIEKVHIVWSTKTTGVVPRWKSKIYLGCMAAFGCITVVLGLMLWGRIAELRADNTCVIGLRRTASVTLLSYDLFMTVTLTSLFVYPLFARKMSHNIRTVAKRTTVASFAALATSTINICVLTIMHGHQLGWVCLASCGTDVTVNALILYWVTNTMYVEGSIATGDASQGGGNGSRNTKAVTILSPVAKVHDPSTASPNRRRFTHFAAAPVHADGATFELTSTSSKRVDIQRSNSVRDRSSGGIVDKLQGMFRNQSGMASPTEANAVKIHVTQEFESTFDPGADLEDNASTLSTPTTKIFDVDTKPQELHHSRSDYFDSDPK